MGRTVERIMVWAAEVEREGQTAAWTAGFERGRAENMGQEDKGQGSGQTSNN